MLCVFIELFKMVFAMVDKHLKHYCETYVNENNARFRIQNRIYSIFPFWNLMATWSTHILKNDWRFCFSRRHCANHQYISPKINYSFKFHKLLPFCYRAHLKSLSYVDTICSIKRFVVQPAILLPPRKNGLHFPFSFAEEGSLVVLIVN